jgi:predicted transglutaminase-like cysteine proteinase
MDWRSTSWPKILAADAVKSDMRSVEAQLPGIKNPMTLSWKRILLIGLVIATLLVFSWQVNGQSPEQERNPEISPTEETITQPAPREESAVEEHAPEEKPVASPPSKEPTVKQTETSQPPETKADTEEAPAEKSGEKPVQTQQPAVKQPRPQPRPAPRPAPLIFGTATTAHADLTPFPQWTGSLQRYFARRSQVSGPCRATTFNGCHMQRWKTMLQEVRGETRVRQLNLVNRYMNTHRYVVDPINWGVTEYWAIPNEFLKKFGDCEDYAIAKYLSLRALGWSADDMRIVVLQDMNLRVMHAILIVNFQGKNMLLDNQITLVIDSNKVHHYKPVYSLNEKGWWRHTPAR